MGTYTFNQEMKRLLKQSDNPALRYINQCRLVKKTI